MLDLLAADGPHPAHADALMLFGRFVGTWAIEDPINDRRGEWRFGWVLEGRAIQDVLVSPGVEHGTTIRVLDPERGVWHVAWATPYGRAIRRLTARPDGDRIVLEGTEPDGTLLRWSFGDIAHDRFVWRGELSRDGGATWVLDEEMHARRVE